MEKKKPKKQKSTSRPPIGEELKIARDQLWNPRLDASKRMPMSDILMPIDRIPSSKPVKRPLPVIKAIAEEMRQVYGDCPAVDMFLKKMLEEAGFVEIPHDRKSFDELMDEMGEQDEQE